MKLYKKLTTAVQVLFVVFLFVFAGTQDVSAQTLPSCTTSLNIPDDNDGIASAMDIDKNNNGLIEICDLEGINAIRHQLDGTGYKASSGATKITTGCRSGGCKGYELTRSLNFTNNASYGNTANRAAYTVSDYSDSNDRGWTPIGSSSDRFRAMFDGNGNTISNLMINRDGSNRIGLFGYTNDKAEITNIGLLNVNVIGNNGIGSLVGSNSGTITDSYATGDVEGDSRVGGLVGESENSGTTASIINSYATVDVESKGEFGVGGGLVGDNGGTITDSYATGNIDGKDNGVGILGGLVGDNSGTITNSYATGNVEGRAALGGLAGSNAGTITDSYATGDVEGNQNQVGGLVGNNTGAITDSYATGDVEGASFIGGLVGASNETIERSYATGKVEGKTEGAGGLVGNNTDTITDSYATGIVEGNARVGGLVGDGFVLTGIPEARITNSYATGTVSGNSSVDDLVGLNLRTLISNSYKLSESSNLGIRRTAEELKSPTMNTGIYSQWNPTVWDFGTSDQFPALKDSDGNLLPTQGMILEGELREGLRNLEVVMPDGGLNPTFGVSTTHYVITIANRNIVLRLTAYNPEAEIAITRSGDTTNYFAGKSSGEESNPIPIDANTILTITAGDGTVPYQISVELAEGIRMRVKVFLEGPLQ